MARQERPVDPAAGPLQALAYDLRKLRAEAGNPTYRVLARSAGYSATTLSEAAGGTRLPTLDVLLAYAGACHGDPDHWRNRWLETAARLHPDDDEKGDDEKGDDEDGESAPGERRTLDLVAHPGGPTEVRRRRWIAVGGLVAMILPIGMIAMAGPLDLVGPGDLVRPAERDNGRFTSSGGGPPPASGGPGCPVVPSDAAFTGLTYGSGAHVRTGATRDSTVRATIPPDCTVGFTGFCIGEKVYDNTAGTPDVRWFVVAGGGVLSSAVIHGNPPGNLTASGCPGGRPAPSELAFSTALDPTRRGAVTLHATGAEVDVVGFARSTGGGPATPGHRTWRQVELVDVRDRAAGAKVRLDVAHPSAAIPSAAIPSAAVPSAAVPSPAGGPSSREPVILVAVACLGGDSPTGVIEARQLHPTTPGRSVPIALNLEQRLPAAASACRYPDRG
ncbi:helix-turn-helix domain-containing protein [Plantactinospora alkalitolerans]|uniref:helix-turn-helix domain-containing protein n=1 Tax=Plantactinospora alkalitolerans TaxID=2789879 RepID=UPI001E5D0591|nr:helix-turn-helix transcriptional regulator [Plantactinospora alkalitolerans]